MAISTYAELQTAVDNWLARTDLSGRSPEWIALFEAKVKRKNVKLPSRITVTYKVTDPATGQVRIAENVTLKPKDYINIGSFIGYTVGSSVQFDGAFTYKSTVNGRRYTAKNSQTITMPTNDELVAGGVKACV